MGEVISLVADDSFANDGFDMTAYNSAREKYNSSNPDTAWDDLPRNLKLPLWQAAHEALNRYKASEGESNA